MSFCSPEKYRLTNCSSILNGNNGIYLVVYKLSRLRVIASDGGDWEHVSVSLPTRCPTWDEMCFIKNLFWDEEDTVIQYHPSKKNYVNNHPYCLHLWRPTNLIIPTPPTIFVGYT
jgi:hypothetical protein